MTNQTLEKNTETTPVSTEVKTAEKPTFSGRFNNDKREGGEFKKNRRQPKRRERPRSEFDQKILSIRRVTRVASGGRRFTFSVAMVVGNKKGKVGVGTGKAGDTSMAIDKAVKSAKKNSIEIKTIKGMSIPHEVSAKYCSARVMMRPARGRGIIAGSAMRDCLELAGLNDINGKIISGSKNKLNIAWATIKALESLSKPKRIESSPKKDKNSKISDKVKKFSDSIKKTLNKK